MKESDLANAETKSVQARDDGGPAFPTISHSYGMTLRDYFAGQVAASEQIGAPQTRAKWAYEVADAMIKARSA